MANKEDDFRELIETATEEVYRGVKEKIYADMATQTIAGAAERVLFRINEKLHERFVSDTGYGFTGSPERKKPIPSLETEKRVALLYLQMLLTELRQKDPNPENIKW